MKKYADVLSRVMDEPLSNFETKTLIEYKNALSGWLMIDLLDGVSSMVRHEKMCKYFYAIVKELDRREKEYHCKITNELDKSEKE